MKKLSPFAICTQYLESSTMVGLKINGEWKGSIRPVYSLGENHPDDFLSEVNMENPYIKNYLIYESQHTLIFDVEMETMDKTVDELTKNDLYEELYSDSIIK